MSPRTNRAGKVETMELKTSSKSSLAQRILGVVAAALIVMPAVAEAESGSATSRAPGNVDFRIVIPATVRVERLVQPKGFSITDADLSRGYVDVEGGTSLLLSSNSYSGFAMSLGFDPALMTRVVARFEGRTIEWDTPGEPVRVDAPKMIRRPVTVAFRIFLAPGLRAGTYDWPVALRFSSTA